MASLLFGVDLWTLINDLYALPQISEYQIIEMSENVCNLKKREADWILKIDIVERGDRLEVSFILSFCPRIALLYFQKKKKKKRIALLLSSTTIMHDAACRTRV